MGSYEENPALLFLFFTLTGSWLPISVGYFSFWKTRDGGEHSLDPGLFTGLSSPSSVPAYIKPGAYIEFNYQISLTMELESDS